MHHFDDLGEVQSALQRLLSREPALVKVLARQPGTKESRYIHLLSGDREPVSSPVEREGPSTARSQNIETPGGGDKLSRLESEITELRGDIADLRQQFAAFRKQFE
jgi:hypothetical protein